MVGVHVRRKIISRRAVWRPLRITFFMICVNLVKQVYQSTALYICSLSLVIFTRTTYTSSSLRVGQKLRGKSEGFAYGTKKRRKSIRLVYHTPKNRPPGVRTPNSKSLTEALFRSMRYINLRFTYLLTYLLTRNFRLATDIYHT